MPEVDKDLSMLQNPEGEGFGSDWEALMARVDTDKAVSIDPEFKTQADVKDFVSKMNTKSDSLNSLREGTRDEKLDFGRSMFETVESARARNQSNAVKGLKAVGGGIVQGGLVVLEELGYVADIDTYTNLFTDVDDLSGNWWSNNMKEAQESVGNSEAFKIYEAEGDQNSIMSQIFKWNSLQSAVSSAVGFGVAGLGAAKLVSYLGNMKKFRALAGFTDAAMGNLKGKSVYNSYMSANNVAGAASAERLALKAAALSKGRAAQASMEGATRAFVGPLATSSMANFFMGQMMAADTYERNMEMLKPLIGLPEDQGGMTEMEAQALASGEAQDVVALNMALALTSYVRFGGIFKRKARFDNLVKNPTALWQMKQLIKTGSPTAFTENVYQEMIQMEQIYDTAVQAELPEEDREYSDNYWERVTQLALSNRAVHAGALGVVGGPIQFAIIQRPMMGKQIKEQRANFKSQDATRTWQKSLVDNDFDVFRQFETNTNEALKLGKLDDATLISDVALMNEVVKGITWGTIGAWRNDMEVVKSMSAEELAAENYSEDSAEIADRVLSWMDKAERYVAESGAYANKEEVAYNLMVTDRVIEQATTLSAEYTQAFAKTLIEAHLEFNKEDSPVITQKDGKLVFQRDEGRFEGLSNAEILKVRDAEYKQNTALENFGNRNANAKKMAELHKDFNKYKKFAKDLQDRRNKITSDAYQKAYKPAQASAMADANKNAGVAQDIKDQEKAKTKDKNKHWVPFSQVRDAKPTITEEEMNKRLAEVKDDTTRLPNDRTPITEETFSSRDFRGDVALYTPGEIRVSTTGEYFQIISQSESKSKLGETKNQMPVARQVGIKGANAFPLGGKPSTIIQDNSFFLPVARQQLSKKGKSSYLAAWAPYVNADYLLQPGNYSKQVQRQEYARNGEVISVNVFAGDAKLEGFEWMSDYNMHLLNDVFTEAYPIVYKKKVVGPSQVYVDVYKRTSDGDVLLTRLDKDFNLAHKDLLNLIDEGNGEVTGEVVGHYSNKYNFNKTIDENNRIVQYPVSDLTGLPSQYKINGELVLMQRKSNKFDALRVARSTSGEVYGETLEATMPDGTTKVFDIPYDSNAVNVGDTAALIISPNGSHLIPIALRGNVLSQMPSLDGGQTFAEDFVQIAQDAVDSFMSEEIANEDAIDKRINSEVENSQKGRSGDSTDSRDFRGSFEFTKKKRDLAFKKGADGRLYKEFKESVYAHVRPRFTQYKIEGTDSSGEAVYATDAKGNKVIANDFFSIEIGVDNLGKFTPEIHIARGRYTIGKSYTTPTTQVERIKLTEDPQRFLEVVGLQKKIASIDTLANTKETTGSEAKAEMNHFINDNGFTTDVNPTNPFVGSSATMTVDGQEFKALSADAAEVHEFRIKSKFAKYDKYTEDTTEISQDKSEEVLEEFNTAIENVLTEEEGLFKSFEHTDSENDIKSSMLHFVDSLGILKKYAARDLMSKLFKEVPEGRQSEYNTEVERLRDRGISNLTEYIARGVLALKDLQVLANAGKMELTSTHKLVTSEDASGDNTQPEGFTFKSNTRVFHDIHGLSIYKYTEAKTGKYRIQPITTKGKPKGKPIVVLAKDVFREQGNRRALSDVKRKMQNLKEDSTQYKALDRTRISLTNKIAREVAKLDGTVDDAGNSNDAGDTIHIVEAMKKVGALDSTIEAVAALPDSTRSRKMAAFVDGLLLASKESVDIFDIVKKDHIEDVIAGYKAFPLNVTDLQNLIDIAEGQLERGFEELTNEKRIIALNNAIEFVEARDKATIDEGVVFTKNRKSGKKIKKSISVIPGLKWTRHGVTKELTHGDAASHNAMNITIMTTAIGIDADMRSSLYAETSTPAPVVNTATKSPQMLEAEQLVETLKENAKFILPYKDGKIVTDGGEYDFYYNTKTKTVLDRTTTRTSRGKKPTGPLVEAANIIGRKIDTLWRDFFSGVPVKFDEKYGIDEGAFAAYIKQLQEVKQGFAQTNQVVVANDIIVYDDVNKVAGTVDILTYDNNGKFRVYDMKTMRKDKFTELTKDGKPIYDTPYRKGEDSSAEQHRKQMSTYRIAMYNTHNILASPTLRVLATKVAYDAGDSMSSEALFLRTHDLTALDKVGDITLKQQQVNIPTETEQFTSKIDRPFIPGSTASLVQTPLTQKFQTVVGAYYAHKLALSNNEKYIVDGEYTREGKNLIDRLRIIKGKDAKALGETIEVLDGSDFSWNGSTKVKVLQALLLDSFSQNKKARNKLVETELDTLSEEFITDVDYAEALNYVVEQIENGHDGSAPTTKPVTSTPKKAPTELKGVASTLAEKYTLPTMPKDVIDSLNIIGELERVTELEDFYKALDIVFASGNEAALDNVFKSILKTVPFKRGEDTTQTQEEFDAEVAAAHALIPNVPTEVVANVAEMVKRYGVKAVGAFDDGVRYLVNKAGKGTAYHETFHAVAALYLSPKQKMEIAEENGQGSWNIVLEEKLAEQFEDYISSYKKPSLKERVLKFFKGLISWATGSKGRHTTEEIFHKIASGGYAKAKPITYFKLPSVITSQKEFSEKISKKNSVLLQKLVKTGKIKIVC